MQGRVGLIMILLSVTCSCARSEPAPAIAQSSTPDWMNYEAVRRIYKLGLPILAASQFVQYDADDPSNLNRAFEDTIITIDSRSIGKLPLTVRKYFRKDYETQWADIYKDSGLSFERGMKSIK